MFVVVYYKTQKFEATSIHFSVLIRTKLNYSNFSQLRQVTFKLTDWWYELTRNLFYLIKILTNPYLHHVIKKRRTLKGSFMSLMLVIQVQKKSWSERWIQFSWFIKDKYQLYNGIVLLLLCIVLLCLRYLWFFFFFLNKYWIVWSIASGGVMGLVWYWKNLALYSITRARLSSLRKTYFFALISCYHRMQ